jgi:hypothetical protein
MRHRWVEPFASMIRCLCGDHSANAAIAVVGVHDLSLVNQ